ncbi:MAG: FAD-dependent oxidoreductase [Rhodospirillales bacterium]
MVSQIRRGILDFVGAARPSIADPFLPVKIQEGRIDDIRECIGCNICVSSDYTSTNLRCTQNPTMGEEWRRGWHPERIPKKGSDGSVLVIGAGPAGLEAALAAARRGYEVHLAEAGSELGGRVERESSLPGLAEWRRVRDWRVGQLTKLANVRIYRESLIEPDHVLGFGATHVIIATGATWRSDGVGRENGAAVRGFDGADIFTPDHIMSGRMPAGPVLIFDDDHYYMGGVIAERCRRPVCPPRWSRRPRSFLPGPPTRLKRFRSRAGSRASASKLCLTPTSSDFPQARFFCKAA